eukprot:COSAG05_NODE_22686_length_263_cov_0.621951_1_plen_41_part_10
MRVSPVSLLLLRVGPTHVPSYNVGTQYSHSHHRLLGEGAAY